MENLPSVIIYFSIVSFVVGILIAIIFDVLNFCNRIKITLNNKVFIFITDTLKCIIFTVSLILLFYYVNDGRSRGVYVLSILFGFLVYRLTVSRLIIRILEITLYPIKKVIEVFIKIINKLHKFFSQTIAKTEERLYNKNVE